MNKKNKFIMLSLTIIIPVLIILLIELISSIWIITSSSSINTSFIEKPDFNPACELDLESLLTVVETDYSTMKHAPEVDSFLTDEQKAFISEHYEITYYKNGSKVPTPVDAGTYTAIYFNKTTHRVTEIEFEINKINPVISVNQEFSAVYYSPTIFETIDTTTFTATGLNGSNILGEFTLSQGTDTGDGVVDEGTSSDQISLEINFEFDTDNPNYNDVTSTFKVPIYAVCHIGAASSPKYYGRIENALKAASASDNSEYIYVLLKGTDLNTINKPIIYENCTISANDTLVAPYSVSGITVSYSKARPDSIGTSTLNGTNGYLYNWTTSKDNLESKNTNIETGTTIENRLFADMDTTTEAKYLKTIITLNNDVIFTVNGKLILGGVLGNAMFSDVQGHTSGNYTQINMRPGSKIICNGNIENRGYIKEVDSNDSYVKDYKCNVIVNNNGTLSMPYVIYDYHGGANMIGTFKGSGSLLGGIQDQPSQISAYNQFDMPNVQSFLTINYGGSLKGYADVYTGAISVSIITLDEQHNSTIVNVVGKEKSLYNMSTGASIDFETILNVPGYTTKTVGSKVTNVYLRGNIELGGVDMTVTVAIITATVSSSEVCLPISYLYNINIESGTFNANNSVKILPGGKINVNGGSVLNIGNGSSKNPEFIIYSSYSNGTGRPPSLEYPTTLEKGKLNINNGTINIKGTSKFGGEITTTSANALINVDKDVTLTMSEEEGYGGSSGTSVTYTQTFSITEKFRLNLLNSNKVSATVTQINTPETFKALEYSTNQYCFTYKYAYINYNTNVLGYELPRKRVDLFDGNNYIGYVLSGDDDYPILDVVKYKPGYSYEWDPILSDPIFSSVTLDAIWTINTYNITYYNYYVDEQGNILTDVMTDKVDNLNSTSFTCLNNIQLVSPTLKNSEDNYVFMGWYSDPDLENLISDFNGLDILSDINIYGKWMEKQEKSFSVTYKQVYKGSSDKVFNPVLDQEEFEFVLSDIKFTYLTSIPSTYNGVISNPFYFAGWYNDESCEGEPLTDDEAKALLTDETNNITLYGKIVDKTYRLKLIDIYGAEHNYYYQDENIIIDNDKYSLNQTQLSGKLLWFNSNNETSDPIFDSNTEYTSAAYHDKFIQNATYNNLYDLTLYGKVYYLTSVTYSTDGYSGISGSVNKGLILDADTLTSTEISYGKSTNTTINYYLAENAVLSFAAVKVDGGKNEKISSGATYNVLSNDGTHTVKSEGENDSCIVSGTLITLADGSKKIVDDITFDDFILVFNHETGQVDVSKMLFITHDNENSDNYEILELRFNNGNSLKIVQEHVLFDSTTNEYVTINKYNAMDYIGHQFYTTEFVNGSYQSNLITLESYSIYYDDVKIYCPVTAFYMNCFANDILIMPSIPGSITGLFNIFELDDDMKYNAELKEADLNKFGIFTYEEFNEFIGYEISYEAYLASPAIYLKVSLGKGLITQEEIIFIIEYLLSGSLIT